MAPRRGGGGGTSFSTSSCGSDAFSERNSKVFIAFYAIFFCVFLGLLIFATVRLRGKPTRGLFIAVLLLALLADATSIIVMSLSECDVIRSEQTNNSNLVSTWLWSLAVFLLVAVIMVPLCRKLGAGRFVTIVLGAWLALLGVVQLAKLAIHTVYVQELNESSYETRPVEWRLRDMRLGLATDSMYFIGILLAAVYMTFSLFRDATSRNGARRSLIILLIVASVAFGTANIAGTAYNYVMVPRFDGTIVGSSGYTAYMARLERYLQSSEALSFLNFFFHALTALAGVLVAASFTLGGHPAPYTGTYAATDPKYGYQAQPQYPSAPAHPHYSYVEPHPPNHTASPPPLPASQPVR